MSTLMQLKKAIDESEALVIGAGAGLSTAAGFEYGGSFFLKYFRYMHDLYGYEDMYSAGFHDFSSSEEKWGYWSKAIYLNRYQRGPQKLYLELKKLLADKNYFIITTNVDHQFQLAGFDKERLHYTQGDYGLFQCSVPCHQLTYDNQTQILEMIQNIDPITHKIPSFLVPRCPICGSEMETNLRVDERFVEDKGWHEARKRYLRFLEDNHNKKVLFLEIGVGFNTPGIIKYPFWQMMIENPKSVYACLNHETSHFPREIEERTIFIKNDIKETLEFMLSITSFKETTGNSC